MSRSSPGPGLYSTSVTLGSLGSALARSMARSISASVVTTLCGTIWYLAILCLAMYFLPQSCEFHKVQSRCIQNLLHVGPLGVRWPNGIVPIRYCDGSAQSKIDDHLCLAGETVNMTRRMIVRIGDKQNAL